MKKKYLGKFSSEKYGTDVRFALGLISFKNQCFQ